MRFLNTLLAVKDIAASKQFYHDILRLEVLSDFGANAVLTGGIALQTLETWAGFLHKPESEIILKNNAVELYFEESEIEDFCEQLPKDIQFVHGLREHSWGQRVVRFYDPDGHIIEVGENMAIVARRFIDSGMTIAETAKRMDVPVDYVEYLFLAVE
ncbi:MAG: VOC family protein [Oscillospiraceae bacterium]|jgi:catechol 2,3-dioxygenase-like lactoylglutathione lyase family enzyme|nr:VOC family protein [Oscillospiraceae bacterium]